MVLVMIDNDSIPGAPLNQHSRHVNRGPSVHQLDLPMSFSGAKVRQDGTSGECVCKRWETLTLLNYTYGELW